MKNQLAILSFLLGLASLPLAQTPQIALVKPNGTTYIFTKFDSAYVYAANGDFIYLPGGNFTANNPINKKLFIYGAGYNIDSSAATSITKMNNLIIYSGAASGLLEGIQIASTNCNNGCIRFGDTNNSNPIDGYSVRNCLLLGGIQCTSACSNILIANNQIEGYNCNGSGARTSVGGNLSNSIINNNIISGNISTNGPAYLLVTNNIFFYAQIYNYGELANYSTYENNIFQTQPYTCSYSNFNNNSNVSLAYGTENILIANLVEQWDSTFIDPGDPSIYGHYPGYDVHKNYNIRPSSICHNGGTDGTDLGIYGGGMPWPDGSIPSNPHIYFKDIDEVTGSDGKLHIEVGVRTNN